MGKEGDGMKRAIVAAFVAGFLCASCGGGSSRAPSATGGGDVSPAYGDTYVEGSIGDVSGFLSAVTSDSASHDAAGYVFNGLVRYDRNLELEGALAEKWDVSPDGKKITFHLRKGVKWHDGAPFTSADVLFTWQRMVDPKTPTAYGEDFRQVKKAYAPDDLTFVAEYDKPFAPALASWGMDVLPKHLLEKYPDISKSPLNREHPVGTGPYRFRERKAGEKIVFDANPDYWEGKPYLARVVTRVIPDQATLFLELKGGGIDTMGLTPLQYARQTDTAEFKANFNRYRYLASAYTYLGFNLNSPLFRDRRVRQAVAWGTDKKSIIDGVLFGLGKEATGPYKPGTYWYDPDVKRYDFDPAKAKALLAEAGWKDVDGDGTLEKEGRKFSFTVLTNAGNDARAKTCAILQQNLAALGIRMEIRTLEWAAFINDFVNPRKFDALLLGWTITPDPDQYDIWSSAKTGPKELNHLGFRNAEVDRLLEEGRRTFDREARRKACFRIQEILAEEQPCVFLYYPDSLPAVQKRIRGIEPAAAGISYNFIKWYVPKGEQKHPVEQP
jgi:peptide/nickel transport system substrate-binding protein